MGGSIDGRPAGSLQAADSVLMSPKHPEGGGTFQQPQALVQPPGHYEAGPGSDARPATSHRETSHPGSTPGSTSAPGPAACALPGPRGLPGPVLSAQQVLQSCGGKRELTYGSDEAASLGLITTFHTQLKYRQNSHLSLLNACLIFHSIDRLHFT